MSAFKDLDPYHIIGFVEVQRQRKAVPYTITHIGDKNALNEWKVAQAAREIDWLTEEAPKRANRRASAIAAVAAQDGRKSDSVKTLEEQSKEERNLRLIAKGKAIQSAAPLNEVHVPKPEPSFIDKAIKWLKGLVS